MSKLFSKELLESCVCTTDKMSQAKQHGNKYVYSEFGLRATYYVYKGKYYIESVEEIK